jgi:16S rRNA (cytosine967-C5)-methyltransferase
LKLLSHKSKPPPAPSARSLALNLLAATRPKGGSVEDLLAATLRRHPTLSRPERAFLLELVQGVKRWELRLDYHLSQLSDIPLKKLHPLVLHILRLSAFQLLMLDRVPARAVLHEAGNLAKARRLPQAYVGFINAVLRRLAGGERPPLPGLNDDPVLALSLATSHPPWLVQRWLERLGLEATQARLTANNQIPPLTIRINTLKTDPETLRALLAREGADAVPCRFSPVGLQLVELKAPPMDLPSYRQGLWLFQDEAAQLVTYLLGADPGQRVLEIGAGRGGKTTHLAEAMHHQGLILAVDHHRRRLQELQFNLERWGGANAQLLRADATAALPLKPRSLDAILVDAPCSALGILRRHPEIKTRLREADLPTFPPRQRAMLEEAAPLLRPGGRLLYVTCTTEPEENEEVVQAFLLAHPEFHLATDAQLLPPAARSLVQPPGFFRSFPETHHLDGFFAALLVRD